MKKRVLFVDDDANLLSGIERSLRSYRKSWQIEVAPDGVAALKILASESFEVLISDMKMPGMTGNQLLEQAAKISPNTIRIILSGQCDEAATIASIPLAHQFITKPTTAKTIVEKIDRALTIAGTLDNKVIQQHLTNLGRIPMAPHSYRETINELQKEEPSIDAIGAIIVKDAMISSKILQIVNSAFFGLPRQVHDPVEAINFLGLDTISTLVLGLGVFYETDSDLVKEFQLDRVMDHSNRVALYARRLAQECKLNREVISLVMTAGLLHDVGLQITASVAPELWRGILEQGASTDKSLKEIEIDVLGATHAQVGAYLLGIWGLPTDVVKLVLHQDKNEDTPPLDMCESNIPYAILNTANHVDEKANLREFYWSHCSEIDEVMNHKLVALDILES